MQVKNIKNSDKRPRGRPKISSLTKTQLGALRVQRWREQQRKKENLVQVEVWITKEQKAALDRMKQSLSVLARKAFELLIMRK